MKPNAIALCLLAELVTLFPGLLDSDTEVNGADLSEHLSTRLLDDENRALFEVIRNN